MKTIHGAIYKFAEDAELPIPRIPLDNHEFLLSKTISKWSEIIAPKPLVILQQIVKYRDKFDSSTPSYLVLFDRRDESKLKSWDERLTWNVINDITVVGC